MLYMAYLTARTSSTNLFQRHPCLFVLAFGMACSKITIKLVVCMQLLVWSHVTLSQGLVNPHKCCEEFPILMAKLGCPHLCSLSRFLLDCKTVVFFALVCQMNACGLWTKGLERVWKQRVGLGRDVNTRLTGPTGMWGSHARIHTFGASRLATSDLEKIRLFCSLGFCS